MEVMAGGATRLAGVVDCAKLGPVDRIIHVVTTLSPNNKARKKKKHETLLDSARHSGPIRLLASPLTASLLSFSLSVDGGDWPVRVKRPRIPGKPLLQ